MNFNPEQVQKRIDEIRARMEALAKIYQGAEYTNFQMLGQIGELNVALSERAEIASQRLERLTKHLKWLTVGLIVLTFALLIFTCLLVFQPR
jgi:hypothetical protein